MISTCSTHSGVKLLGELTAGLPVRLLGRTDVPVTGIAYDSRMVRPGNIFAALPGLKHHGSEFVSAAVLRGARAILCSDQVGGFREVSTIVAEDVRWALGELSRRFWDDPSADMSVVGITGTNGKTTVSFLVRHLLESCGVKAGLIGTVHYALGRRVIPAMRTTPESADLQALLAAMKKEGCQAAALEVSSHGLDQKRVAGVHFRVAVFTNLGREHLDYHGDMESYYRAKRRLFEATAAEGGTGVINVDSDWGQRLTREMEGKMRLVRCSMKQAADFEAEVAEGSAAGSVFRVRRSGESKWHEAIVPLPGEFNVSNALLALAAVSELGVGLEQSAAALQTAPAVPGRMEPVPCSLGFRVYVDYAHTPDGLRNVLELVRRLTPGTNGQIDQPERGRVIVVFGCGGDRDRGKRPLMGKVAAELADLVFVTSDNPRTEDPEAIIAEIEAGLSGRSYTRIVDRAEAIRAAIACAAPGDIVLIAGRGHEAYQEIGNRLIPFDDRSVAADVLRELSSRRAG